jgi:ankyrin repeat protein
MTGYMNSTTPLFSACKYGNKDVVDFLLKRNCKVDAINKIGQIALHAACENGDIDIVNATIGEFSYCIRYASPSMMCLSSLV